MLVDSHCHLDFKDFEPDLDAILERARQAGVETFLTIATRLDNTSRSLEIATIHDDVYCSLGIHPHEAEEGAVTLDKLLAATQHPKVIGIGESGLDYHYLHSPKEAQKKSFEIHIEAARQTQLPLVIHARDADDDMADILTVETKNGAFPFLMHCYSSGPELARRAVGLGGYLSLSGILTFRKSEQLRTIVSSLPQDHLLVETDAPYLAPDPYRGKRCEPAFVVHTVRKLAEIRNISFEEIAEITTANFYKLFTKIM